LQKTLNIASFTSIESKHWEGNRLVIQHFWLFLSNSFADGKLNQISGTRNITKTYEYGINNDGTEWTKEYIGL
jgi:hypothetical protein